MNTKHIFCSVVLFACSMVCANEVWLPLANRGEGYSIKVAYCEDGTVRRMQCRQAKMPIECEYDVLDQFEVITRLLAHDLEHVIGRAITFPDYEFGELRKCFASYQKHKKELSHSQAESAYNDMVECAKGVIKQLLTGVHQWTEDEYDVDVSQGGPKDTDMTRIFCLLNNFAQELKVVFPCDKTIIEFMRTQMTSEIVIIRQLMICNRFRRDEIKPNVLREMGIDINDKLLLTDHFKVLTTRQVRNYHLQAKGSVRAHARLKDAK